MSRNNLFLTTKRVLKTNRGQKNLAKTSKFNDTNTSDTISC